MIPSWKSAVTALESGLDLTSSDAQWFMREILEGRAETSELSQFLLALKSKGETSEEVGAFVSEMFNHSAPINVVERSVDTVGTGGDGAHTINISTTAAIIAAAAGARVVKHGNRASSSKSGAADLLEALGVNISLDGKGVEKTVSELGIGFCFAQKFHPAMKNAAAVRKELGVPTVFNILGPLGGGTNTTVTGTNLSSTSGITVGGTSADGQPPPTTNHHFKKTNLSIHSFD